jgi:group I intron endonuclease
VAICRAISKYGKDHFSFEVIYQSKDGTHTLDVMEPYFISLYQSFGRGYNLTAGGEGTYGYKRTPEQIERMRLRASGHIASMETKRKMSESQRKRPAGILHPNYGKKRSKDSIAKQVEHSTGKTRSASTREKQSQAQRGSLGSGYGKVGALHKQAKGYLLIKADGSTFTFTGLADFARQNGYSQSALCSMAKGRTRKYKDVVLVEFWHERQHRDDHP